MPRKKWTKKDERMYTKIYASCVKTRKRSRLKQIRRGRKPMGGEPRMVCKRIAAATVNKRRTKRRVKRPKRRRLRGLAGTRRGISVDRERLDRGGYTSSGRYFGTGEPLYQWWHEASGEGGYVRARNAKEARAKVEAELQKTVWRDDPEEFGKGRYMRRGDPW